MKIGFATADWSETVPDENESPSVGGAGWYRSMLPMRWLNDHGHECRIGTLTFNLKTGMFMVQGWDGDTFEPEVIVMQRYMHESIIRCLKLARAEGQIIVNDMDDWFFGLDKKNHAYRSTDPRTNGEVNRVHYAEVLRWSTAITVSTPYLRDECRKMFPKTRVELLRNAIDLERWKPKEVREAKPVVGWVGAAPWRSGDLSTEGARATAEFCNANELFFHHSGEAQPDPAFFQRERMGTLTTEEKRLAREWFTPVAERLGVALGTSQPMCSIIDYPKMFGLIDVGIVPLADVPFNYAKSAIKAMEYAASGIPFIAQSLPEQVWLRAERGIGRTARARADWSKELRRMLDPAWRREQRDKNLAGVQALDVAARGQDWASLYESLSA